MPGKKSAAPSPPSLAFLEPIGLGGWLWLPTLGFLGAAIKLGWDFVGSVLTLRDVETFVWEDPQAAALLAPLASAMVLELLVAISACTCLVLLVFCKRSLIWVATLHYLLIVTLSFVGLWALHEQQQVEPTDYPDPSAMRQMLSAVAAAAIWIPYFHVSRRVKNTFTR